MMILDFLFGKKIPIFPINSIIIEDVEDDDIEEEYIDDEEIQTISIIDRDIELFNSMEITAIYSSDDIKKINNNL